MFLVGKQISLTLFKELSYLSEVGASRGLLNLGEKHLDHQSLENLMQSKRTGPQF